MASKRIPAPCVCSCCTTTFAVQGLDLGRDWAVVGGGYQVRLNPHARFFAGYDVQFNDRQTFHIGSGGVEVVW